MNLITFEKAAQAFNSIKENIDKAVSVLNSFEEINDENHEEVLRIAGDSNKILKEIEKRRKEMKQPFTDAGKVIDETAKKIADDLDKAVADVKIRISTYESIKRRKYEEEQRKLKEEEEAKLKEIAENAKIVSEIYNELSQFVNQAYEGISKTRNEQELKISYKKYVTDFPEKFKIVPDYENSIKLIKDYGKAHRELVLAYLSAKEISDEKEAKIRLEQMTMLYNKMIGKKEEEIESAKQAIIEKIEEEAAEVIADKVINSSNIVKPKSASREYLSFEVVDESEVPKEFLSVDEKKVSEFMKDHAESIKEKIKATPTEYIIYAGIKFYLKQSTVLR